MLIKWSKLCELLLCAPIFHILSVSIMLVEGPMDAAMVNDDEFSRSRERRRGAESGAKRDPTRLPVPCSESEESEDAKDIIPKEFKWLNKKAKKRDAKQLSLLGHLSSRVETVEDSVGQLQNQQALLSDRMAAMGARTSSLEADASQATRGASMAACSPLGSRNSELKDENELKIEIKGFLYDTPKETISAFVKLHYSSYVTPSTENGLADVPFVPGKRSTKMVFEFKAKRFCWKFLKYVNANRVQSQMPKPLSGEETAVNFCLWAAFAQDAATKSHASVVGKVARTLHIMKESGKLPNFTIETSYGSHRAMLSGKVIAVEGSRSVPVASIKSTEHTWSDDGLTKIGLTQEEVNTAMSAM